MNLKRDLQRTRLPMTRLLMIFMSLLLTCSTMSQALAETPPPQKLVFQPIPEGMVAVPEKDINELVEYAQHCKDFSKLCQQRVGLLEEYKKESDKMFADQEAKVQQYRDEASSLKSRNNYIYPALGILLGIVGGRYLISR